VTDPFATLGLAHDASLDDVRAARRRLAFELHPDRGGDEGRMREVNEAFDAVVRQLTGRAARPAAPPPRPAPEPAPTRRSSPADLRRGGGPRRVGVEHDVASFVIEALPVEAFEAMLVVVSWIGEPLVDDSPYLLEAHLQEPAPCWCRFELVPDAGATTVSLTVAGVEGEAPSVDAVRDVLVAHLNQLGRHEG
jgi:hypothetical protein